MKNIISVGHTFRLTSVVSSHATTQTFKCRSQAFWNHKILECGWIRFTYEQNTPIETETNLVLNNSLFGKQLFGKQLMKGTILFIFDPITDRYNSLIYETLFHPLSGTLFDALRGLYAELHITDRWCAFRKYSVEILKRLASAINTATPSREQSVHKIARQQI